MLQTKKADFNEIGKKYNISPILARIIRNRDVIGDADINKYLNGSLKDLYAPNLLKDMDNATDILLKKIEEGKHIRIIGDYDIDGVSSTFILLKGLTSLGAKVDYAIPHRIKDGYGLNENLVREALEAGADTILTCDNGIAAKAQIAYAKENDMTVIITDHHEVPFEEIDGKKNYILPSADAVVDPKQADCPYPFSEICGAVVAFKLILNLISKKENKDWFSVLMSDLGQELLEFAAFATIGDVMELKDENRIIVKEGIKLMHDSRNIGLRALCEVNNIELTNIKPYTIGFVLGPCLNATGRLDTATTGLELFNCKTRGEALVLAGNLKAMNDSRKELTLQGVDEAIEKIETSDLKNQKVLVVYLPNVHESLAGIIAGRIREKYCKPTFVLTKVEDGVKGSGRSIDAFNMYEEMTKCKELFTKFGGHKLAAGLSLPEENVETLRRTLNENTTLTDADLVEKVMIDIPLPFSYANMDLMDELEKLEPFGNGNSKPLFAQKKVTFTGGRYLGNKGNAAKYQVVDENGQSFELMHFGDISEFDDFLAKKYGIAQQMALYREGTRLEAAVVYYPDINEFRGETKVQLIMKYYS